MKYKITGFTEKAKAKLTESTLSLLPDALFPQEVETTLTPFEARVWVKSKTPRGEMQLEWWLRHFNHEKC